MKKNIMKYIDSVKEIVKEIFDEENIKGIEMNVCWKEVRYYKEQA